MAQRRSAKKLTASELIVQKLKETFDRKGASQEKGLSWEPGSRRPTHHVRVVLRTSDAQEANPYVDGWDFFLEVDEQQHSAEFVWEDESFANAPLLHGSEVLTAIRWTSELAETLLCIRLEGPFSTKTTERLAQNETKQETKEVDEAWPIPSPCQAMSFSKPAAGFSEKTCVTCGTVLSIIRRAKFLGALVRTPN